MEVFLIAEEDLRCPLNAHLTVTFDGSGTNASDVKRMKDQQTKLITSINQFLQRRNHPVVFIYARASAELGLHLHMLLHITPNRWLEITGALRTLINARLTDLGVTTRKKTLSGEIWLPFKLTPPQSEHHADEPADIENRLRLLGYLPRGVDPAALVETSAGYVPFIDLLRFYLQADTVSQGTIRGAKRFGHAQHISPTLTLNAVQIFERLNALHGELNRLPPPDFVARELGPCSPTPDDDELLERAQAVNTLRTRCRRERRDEYLRAGMAGLRARAA